MRAEAVIVDADNAVVGRAVWHGTLYEGTLVIVPAPGRGELARAVATVRARPELRRVRFRSAGARPFVRGGQGAEGTFGALRLALPAIGLRLLPADVTALGAAPPTPGVVE